MDGLDRGDLGKLIQLPGLDEGKKELLKNLYDKLEDGSKERLLAMIQCYGAGLVEIHIEEENWPRKGWRVTFSATKVGESVRNLLRAIE